MSQHTLSCSRACRHVQWRLHQMCAALAPVLACCQVGAEPGLHLCTPVLTWEAGRLPTPASQPAAMRLFGGSGSVLRASPFQGELTERSQSSQTVPLVLQLQRWHSMWFASAAQCPPQLSCVVSVLYTWTEGFDGVTALVFWAAGTAALGDGGSGGGVGGVGQMGHAGCSACTFPLSEITLNLHTCTDATCT